MTAATQSLRAEARRAIAGASGVVLYEGPSHIDGAPVVAVATGLRRPSSNTKTGAMAQVWIMPAGVPPTVAVATGADASVCGDCRYRPSLSGGCYVVVAKAPSSVWRAWRAGRYWHVDIDAMSGRAVMRGLLLGLPLRLGAWGDPAALPPGMVARLAGLAARHTGYTHQWRHRPDLRPHLMGSVDTDEEEREARAAGWRTFRVLAPGSAPSPGVIECPSARTTCAACALCDGARPGDRRRSIAIEAHGASRRLAVAAAGPR